MAFSFVANGCSRNSGLKDNCGGCCSGGGGGGSLNVAGGWRGNGMESWSKSPWLSEVTGAVSTTSSNRTDRGSVPTICCWWWRPPPPCCLMPEDAVVPDDDRRNKLGWSAEFGQPPPPLFKVPWLWPAPLPPWIWVVVILLGGCCAEVVPPPPEELRPPWSDPMGWCRLWREPQLELQLLPDAPTPPAIWRYSRCSQPEKHIYRKY